VRAPPRPRDSPPDSSAGKVAIARPGLERSITRSSAARPAGRSAPVAARHCGSAGAAAVEGLEHQSHSGAPDLVRPSRRVAGRALQQQRPLSDVSHDQVQQRGLPTPDSPTMGTCQNTVGDASGGGRMGREGLDTAKFGRGNLIGRCGFPDSTTCVTGASRGLARPVRHRLAQAAGR
jgi:hypothetical protein